MLGGQAPLSLSHTAVVHFLAGASQQQSLKQRPGFLMLSKNKKALRSAGGQPHGRQRFRPRRSPKLAELEGTPLCNQGSSSGSTWRSQCPEGGERWSWRHSQGSGSLLEAGLSPSRVAPPLTLLPPMIPHRSRACNQAPTTVPHYPL